MKDQTTFLSPMEAKKAILEIGWRMYQKNYVAANDGNISIKCSDNEIWVTPTGVSKGYMKEDMLVKIDGEGKLLEGKYKPSSEVKMHLRIYKENPNVTAVTHAHPIFSTAFAIAGVAFDLAYMPEAVVNLGVVPVVPYATPGSTDLPDGIAPYVNTHNAVLLANHGALTWGTSIEQAFFRLESLEHYAQIITNALYVLEKGQQLTKENVKQLIRIRENLGVYTGGVPLSLE